MYGWWTPTCRHIIPGPEGAPSVHGTRVLLVDDVEDNREIYAQFLRFEGYEVSEARNGIEALQLAATERPAIIILDLSMPGLDGWEVCRRLKADPGTRDII